MNVSFFENLRSKGYQVELRSILEDIKNGRWADSICNVRELPLGSQAYQKAKRGLSSFMVSGTSNGGRKSQNFLAHSGYLQIDIDKVEGESVFGLRDRLGQDPHILAAWLSPSGRGVKAIMLIPACSRLHKKAFKFAYEYMRRTYSVEIDPSCSDLTRICYVSYDPDLVQNNKAISINLSSDCSEEVKNPHSSTMLYPKNYILHNNNQGFSGADLFKDHPELESFYQKQVAVFFPEPRKGTRNAALKEIIARCFCMVAPEFVHAFAEAFFYKYHNVFADYGIETYRNESRVLLEGCHSSYPKRLSERERDIYLKLSSETSRAAFRVAKSLASCESDPSLPPPLFALSASALGIRLGLYDTQASRILKAFDKYGLIRLERLGSRRLPGQRGLANVWRWMPCVFESYEVGVASLVEDFEASCGDCCQ
jgi:hypothetical protein